MSDPITALNGAVSQDGIAEIREVPLQGMITLRGDLGDKAVQKAVAAVVPDGVPAKTTARISGQEGIAWMSPDEVLILCAYGDVPERVSKLQDALGDAHALVVNVSDARASFTIEGAHARDVLAKLCPVDLAPESFAPGMFRRTRMAQVPAALWQTGEPGFQVICFRSQAQYVFDLLCVAAQPGSEVSVSS